MKSSRKSLGNLWRTLQRAAGGFSPRPGLALVLAALAFAGLVARADLPRWFQNIRAVKRFEGVFTTTVAMPGGTVTVRRDPAQTRASLTQLIAAARTTPNSTRSARAPPRNNSTRLPRRPIGSSRRSWRPIPARANWR